MHDIVIRGGFLVDGTGAPAREADVAIVGGVISAAVLPLVGLMELNEILYRSGCADI